jgi:hypothetical protein
VKRFEKKLKGPEPVHQGQRGCIVFAVTRGPSPQLKSIPEAAKNPKLQDKFLGKKSVQLQVSLGMVFSIFDTRKKGLGVLLHMRGRVG